ncbi:MAG: putative lipid II flippase FtsW [Synergistales bacterium]|nr:putative lipid II flippase FtsW [Synergistales bacterium]
MNKGWGRAENKVTVQSIIWVIPLLLCGLSVLMVASATSGSSLTISGEALVWGYKQACWVVAGFVMMLVVYVMPVNFWRRGSGLMWGGALILVGLTLIPGLGVHAGGASRWLALGPVTLQTSEVLSFAVVLHAARKANEEDVSTLRLFLRCMAIALSSSFLLLMQPDFGGAVIVFVLTVGVFAARRGWFYPLLGSFVVLVTAVPPLVMMKSYRLRRILACYDPWSDPLDAGFQAIQGLIAFASGGLWGQGVGKGLQKMAYLPAAHTDFIFATLGEEVGLVGTLGVLAAFTVWVIAIWREERRLRDPFLATLLWGATLSVVLPVIVNIGGELKLLPLTGVVLPFLSYGGSAMVMAWMKVGIIVRLTRYATLESR